MTAPDGRTLFDASGLADMRVVPEEPATRLQIWSKPSPWDTYRGSLRLIASGGSVSVVDHVGLDAYLLGVVPVEMPAAWPTEALRAQAIVARSYAAKRMRSGGSFDLFDDTRSQVYRGVKAEMRATTRAVTDTAGKVVLFGRAIADTYYHSAGGGATEDNEKAWVGPTGARIARPIPYLRGSSDRRPDGTAYDAASLSATWRTATYTVGQLSAVFARDPRTDVGTLRALDLSRRGVSGRLLAVTLVGSRGARTVSGEVFRTVFNAWRPAAHPQLRSTLFGLSPIP